MSAPFIFVKDLQSTVFAVDLSALLNPGETVQSATVARVTPTTAPPLLASVSVPPSLTGLTLPVSGGTENTSYGVSVDVVTTLQTLTVTCAVQVTVDLNLAYATRNPNAFEFLVDTLEAGDAALGKGFFVLPANTDVSDGYVTWEILDNSGTLYSTGNAFSYYVTQDAFTTLVEASALVSVPSSTPPTLDQQRYTLRWQLHSAAATQYTSETVRVTQLASVPLGAESTVELAGDLVQLGLVLDKLYPSVEASVFNGNAAVISARRVADVARVSSGWYYRCAVDTSGFAASLDPYLVSWRYSAAPPAPSLRQQGKMFLVNPMIMSAVDDVQHRIMKARTSLFGQDVELFDPVTVMVWLRRGRDAFNAAYGMITSFDMTQATGGVREYWLTYAEIEALRAQYLAEGERAFDLQGQSISLNVDRTQYYSGLADTLQQTLADGVRDYKKNLQIKGIVSGNGDVLAASSQPGALGCVGLGWNAVSPAHTWGFPRMY